MLALARVVQNHHCIQNRVPREDPIFNGLTIRPQCVYNVAIAIQTVFFCKYDTKGYYDVFQFSFRYSFAQEQA